MLVEEDAVLCLFRPRCVLAVDVAIEAVNDRYESKPIDIFGPRIQHGGGSKLSHQPPFWSPLARLDTRPKPRLAQFLL